MTGYFPSGQFKFLCQGFKQITGSWSPGTQFFSYVVRGDLVLNEKIGAQARHHCWTGGASFHWDLIHASTERN